MTDGHAERIRVDLDRAEIGTFECRVGVDIEPANINIDEPTGDDVDVDAELSCRAK